MINGKSSLRMPGGTKAPNTNTNLESHDDNMALYFECWINKKRTPLDCFCLAILPTGITFKRRCFYVLYWLGCWKMGGWGTVFETIDMTINTNQ